MFHFYQLIKHFVVHCVQTSLFTCLFLPNSKLIGVTEEHVLAKAFHSCVIKQPSMNNR